MYMVPYDSPTFLNQKDKYMLGLSLPEMVIAMAIGGGWFILLLFFEMDMVLRLVLLVPCTGITMAFIFARIAGLLIPMYFLLSIVRIFKRPSFEEVQDYVVQGEPAWLELQRQRAEGTNSRFHFLKRGRKLAESVPEARKAELKAEMDKQVTEGAVAMEHWARDAVQSVLKGK